ncbi:DUF5683 domain-containing protein [Mesohalobacter halotolerans]|uniref:DUF5683 domain-containing protein n=1 Tax=Mesohalobacter halotolerans TaxID=1883405 RepID=A0A4U5TQ94_9FLAO|nr:DUF5683 domain-containing protein [Mesohalobacter halotolerans]MBS3739485.1 hypothetical protein [Psychroflexus sp.]TKS56370.1 hypothetical protein FCN74_04825 [Mesohalobacter halotolerans]
MKNIIFIAVFISFLVKGFTQNDSIPVNEELQLDKTVESKSFEANPFDANAPAKAAFYSAVLPGLGQAYNKSYWKIPLAYIAIGTPLYFYIDNNNQYHSYRDAFKSRLAGFENDEFIGILNDDDLIEAQKLFRENRDLSLLLTIAAYILNIIDANVEAHLNQFNISDDLTLQPRHLQNFSTGQQAFGLSLNLKLN